MTGSLIDDAVRRNNMVDGQLRPNKVSDSRVLGAMRTLPRERFLPAALSALAYADHNVMLPGGRCLIEPMFLARLVQLADPGAGERVLVVGAGTGYGAAVLSVCGACVVALEDDENLLRIARTVLPEVVPEFQVTPLQPDPGPQIVSGPLASGWPKGAPYDLVFIEGGFEQVPEAIAEQVRPAGGRLVGVRAAAGRIGQAVVGERVGAAPAISLRPVFDCAVPVLPGLRHAPGFVF